MKVLLATLCLFITYSGWGQTALSLQQAQAFGLINNEKVINANIDYAIAKKKIRETTGIGLPQVSGSLGFNNFLDIPTTVVPARTFNPMAPEGEIAELKFGSEYTAEAGFQIAQILFNGNYLVGLQAAKAYANTSAVLIEKSKLEVKYDIADAYYTVLMLKNNKDILVNSYQNMNELLRQTKILVSEKVVESTQASQLELSVLQIRDGMDKMDAQIDVAKDLLKMQMGMDLTTDIVLTDDLDYFLGESLIINESFDPNNNITHKILNTQLTLNQLNLKNKQANFLPTVTAFLSHKQSAQRGAFNFFDGDKSWYPTSVWGINISLPIYSGGQTKAKVDQAKLEIIKTENNIKQADRGLQLQMKQAVSNYNNAMATYNTQLKAVDVAKTIIDNTETKFKLGTVMSLELTQVESQYLNTKSALNMAIYNLVKAKHEIDKLQNK